MRKKAGILSLIFLIILGIIILVILAGVYFYNFYVFKTLRVCIGQEALETEIICQSNSNCIDSLKNDSQISGKIKEVPDFLKPKIDEAFEKAVLCENTCKIKKIYGAGLDNIKDVEKCKDGEEEVSYEIRGKEVLKVLSYMK